MKYKVTLNNRVYEIEVEEGTAMLVLLPQRPLLHLLQQLPLQPLLPQLRPAAHWQPALVWTLLCPATCLTSRFPSVRLSKPVRFS